MMMLRYSGALIGFYGRVKRYQSLENPSSLKITELTEYK